jgi:hypothetical protein
MNDVLENELKYLSIESLNELFNFFILSKKKLFTQRKYTKNIYFESDINSITELKNWVNNLSRKSKDNRANLFDQFMFYYDHIEKLLNKKIDEVIDSDDIDYINELNKKCNLYFSIIKSMGNKEDYIDRLGISINLYKIKIGECTNENLLVIMKNLRKKKINISIHDFNLIMYVQDYMSEFNKYIDDDKFIKIMNNILKDYKQEYPKFDEYLYLSLLNILNKKKNDIIKYLDKSVRNKLENVQSNSNDIRSKYIKTKREYTNLLGNDNLTIIDYFKNNKRKMSLYEENNKNINKIISSISNIKIYNSYSSKDLLNYTNNLIEFYWDLDEYKFVCDYKYIFDAFEEMRLKKFDIKVYKSTVKSILLIQKRIINLNKLLIKENKKLSRVLVMESNSFYIIQKNVQRITHDINEYIDELLEKIDEYHELKILKNIHDSINDKSTVHDALKILNRNFFILVKLAPIDYEKILEMEYFHHLSLLDNIYFNHINSIKLLIEQKYNIYNINIVVPDVNSNEFNELKENLSVLIRYLNILNNKLTIEDIKIVINR